MKSEQTKQKALALYIDSMSTEKIAKEVGVQRKTVREWERKFGWKQIREEAVNRVAEKQPQLYQEIIETQMDIVKLAHKELLLRLTTGDIKFTSDLVQIMKHGLEIIRPKTTSQLNFLNQDVNKGIVYQFEVKDARDQKNTVIKKTARSTEDTE